MKKIISLFIFALTAVATFADVVADIDFGMLYPKDSSRLYLIEYKMETTYYDGEGD